MRKNIIYLLTMCIGYCSAIHSMQLPGMQVPTATQAQDVAIESVQGLLAPLFNELKASLQKSGELALSDVLNYCEQIPIPSPYREMFLQLKIVGAKLGKGLLLYPGSFSLQGTTTINGIPISLSMLFTPLSNSKRGLSASFLIPGDKKLIDVLPAIESLIDFPVSGPRFVLSNFEYRDLLTIYRITPGFNIIGSVPIDSLPIPGMEQAKSLLKPGGGSLVMRMVLTPTLTDSSIGIEIPSNMLKKPEISLSELISFATTQMPVTIMNSLKTVIFKNYDLLFDLKPGQESFAVAGTVSFLGQQVGCEFRVSRLLQGNVATKASFYMPEGWDITRYFPPLKSIITMPVKAPVLTFTSAPYLDDTLGMDLMPGMHFNGTIEMDLIGKSPIFKVLDAAIGKDVMLHGLLSANVADSIFDIIVGRGTIPQVSLGEIINLDEMHLPVQARATFAKTVFAITDIDIQLGATQPSVTIHGTMGLAGRTVETTLSILSMLTGWKTNMIALLPGDFKISDIISDLKALDAFGLEDVNIGFISAPFSDVMRGFDYKTGFNINGKVDFTGPLSGVEKLTQMQDVIIGGVLGEPPTETILSAKIPLGLRIGTVRMDNIALNIHAKASFGLAGTFYIPMAKEPQPLKFVGELDLVGDTGVIGAAMEGVWKDPLGMKGLTIYEAGLEGGVNAVTALPSGLGIRGVMDVGRQKMAIATKGAVGATTSDFIIAGSLKNGLYLDDIVMLADKMISAVSKVSFYKIVSKKIPKFGLDEVDISMAALPVTIVGKTYPEGVHATIKMELFGVGASAGVEVGLGGVKGFGLVDKVAVGPISLTNLDGTAGPSLSLKAPFIPGLSEATLMDGVEFSLDGRMSVDLLGGMSSAVKCLLNADGVNFHMTSKVFSIYESDIEGTGSTENINDIMKWRIKGTFKQSGLQILSDNLRDSSEAFVQENMAEMKQAQASVIASMDAKIEKQRAIVIEERDRDKKKIKGEKKELKAAMEKEMAETKAEIARLNQEINVQNKLCDAATSYQKVTVCAQAKAEIAYLGSQIAAQQTYLNTLLKPGKALSSKASNVRKSAVDTIPVDSDPRVQALIALKEVKLAGIKVGKVSVKTIGTMGNALATMGDQAINIKEVSFDGAIVDLATGRLPAFSINGIFFGKTLVLKDIQLDLKDPIQSAQAILDIITQLL